MSAVARSLLSLSTAVLIPLFAACTKQNGDLVSVACPPAQIAVPADRIGHANDKGELGYVVTMEELASTCRETEGDIEIGIAFTMLAEKGPAFDNQPVQLTYFLATVDPMREIVDKQLLDVQFAFGPDQVVRAHRESLTLRLPASTEASGANYSLYLGFQLEQGPGRTQAGAPRPIASSTLATSDQAQTGTSDQAVEIVFALNSSVLPKGAGDQLRAFIQALDRDKRYVLRVQTSVDSDSRVIGAESVDESQRYNNWLAERRFKRVEAWLRENGDGQNFTLESSIVENDNSRRVRIESNPIG